MNAPKNTEQVTPPTKKKKGRKKKLLLTGVVVLVLGLIAGGVWWYINTYHGQSEEELQEVILTPDEAFERIDAERRESAEAMLAEAETSEERVDAYHELATVYAAPGDYSRALEYAQQAAEEMPSVATWLSVVHYAELAGDKVAEEYANTKLTELGGYSDGYQE